MSYLDDLLDSTRRRVAEASALVTEEVLEQRVASVPPAQSFSSALRGPEISVIAEIKRATPRAGALNLDLDAAAMAKAYRSGGAAAVSVLTEPEFFKGSL